jgi:hypothetical protein
MHHSRRASIRVIRVLEGHRKITGLKRRRRRRRRRRNKSKT